MNKTELEKLSKEQLIDLIIGDETETITTIKEGDKRGQLREVRETRDSKDKLLSTQDVRWTYYENGNVDEITMIEKDAKGKETSRKTIKHNECGGLAVPVFGKIDNHLTLVNETLKEAFY